MKTSDFYFCLLFYFEPWKYIAHSIFKLLQLLHNFTLQKFRFTLRYVYSLNYLRKTILSKKMVNKISEPYHYEAFCRQSACAKRFFTIFSVCIFYIFAKQFRIATYGRIEKMKSLLMKISEAVLQRSNLKKAFCKATFLKLYLHIGLSCTPAVCE